MVIKGKRLVVAASAAGAIILAMVVGVYLLKAKAADPSSLVPRYFNALAASDTAVLEDIVAEGFSSDLPELDLVRGSYELFGFGDAEAGDTQRFLVVADGADGKRKALLADMDIYRNGLSLRIRSIRLVDTGRELKR